ncbi:MAG TPA: hypothetical protein VJ903_01640, partial [Clostridia bacterium]|nr:hypothetical protein [Clostridia bacterium]
RYTGEGTQINLNTLGFAGAIYQRIASLAFTSSQLTEINLGNVRKIAQMAINSKCVNLTRIVLTSSVNPPILESKLSFQIADIHNCYIYVRTNDVSAYTTSWKNFGVSASRIMGE